MITTHMMIADHNALEAARRGVQPLRLLPIHLPSMPLPEVTVRNADTGWQDWDDAVVQLEFADQSERLAWTR